MLQQLPAHSCRMWRRNWQPPLLSPTSRPIWHPQWEPRLIAPRLRSRPYTLAMRAVPLLSAGAMPHAATFARASSAHAKLVTARPLLRMWAHHVHLTVSILTRVRRCKRVSSLRRPWCPPFHSSCKESLRSDGQLGKFTTVTVQAVTLGKSLAAQAVLTTAANGKLCLPFRSSCKERHIGLYSSFNTSLF